MRLPPRIPVSTSHHKKENIQTGPFIAHTQNKANSLARSLASLTPVLGHSLWTPSSWSARAFWAKRGSRAVTRSAPTETRGACVGYIRFCLGWFLEPVLTLPLMMPANLPVVGPPRLLRVPARCCYYCHRTADSIRHIIPQNGDSVNESLPALSWQTLVTLSWDTTKKIWIMWHRPQTHTADHSRAGIRRCREASIENINNNLYFFWFTHSEALRSRPWMHHLWRRRARIVFFHDLVCSCGPDITAVESDCYIL